MSPEVEPRGEDTAEVELKPLDGVGYSTQTRRGSSGSSGRSTAGLRVWWSFCTECGAAQGVKADTG